MILDTSAQAPQEYEKVGSRKVEIYSGFFQFT